MASARVMTAGTDPAKKKLMEEGKKLLDDFRKKKAGGRAKKVASKGQLQPAAMDQPQTLPPNSEHVGSGATTTSGSTSISRPYEIATVHKGEAGKSSASSGIAHSTHSLAISADMENGGNVSNDDILHDTRQDKPSELYKGPTFSERANGHYGHSGVNTEFRHNRSASFEPSASVSENIFKASGSVGTNLNIDGDVNQSRFHFGSQYGEGQNSSISNAKVYDSSGTNAMNSLLQRSRDDLTQERLEFPSTSASIYGVHGETTFGADQSNSGSMNHETSFGGWKNMDSTSGNVSVGSAPWHTSDPPSAYLSLPGKSSSNQPPFPYNETGTTTGRSRSFLADTIGLPTVSSTSHTAYNDPPSANRFVPVTNTGFPNTEVFSSSANHPFPEVKALEHSQIFMPPDKELPLNSNVPSIGGQPSKLTVSDYLHRSQDIQTQKNEDFAQLEQYIEDLTREKFSLQEALKTSQSLTESLTAENASLTESYNQQGQVLSQLQSDIDGMQEEIKAQMLALESIQLECTNAKLECNAADERAKILATEVISLEEKALRLRSNELKLEKQLGNMNSEITSYKYKISSLEKERQDFRSTIDVMVEEKKVLQSMLRKASVSGKSNDSPTTSKRDAFTSTEDLGAGDLTLVDEERNTAGVQQNITPSVTLSRESSSFSSLPEDRRFCLPDGSSGTIPPDQLKMIDNINSLTSELALEKEELMRALTYESANSSKLKELNKDLSQKLESQTQRLELLTAQRMANENALPKPMEIPGMHDTPVYADEGDEVVERVMSWIMKLFPGGTSKRRTSKRL